MSSGIGISGKFGTLAWRVVAQGALVAMACGFVAGCAKEASLQPINGKYYMVGDDGCQYARPNAGSTITCFDSDKRPTGNRAALSSDQINMYLYDQSQQTQQMQQLNQSMQQTNQSIQQQNMQYQQYQPYTAPSVTPIAPSGGNQVRCISTDIYTNCRY